MKALSIAFKDLLILLENRGDMILLFLMPLVFVVVMTGALGNIGKGEKDTRILLPVVNLDGGESAQALLDRLDVAGGVRVELYEQTEAMDLLGESEIGRVLIVPADFTTAVAAGQPVMLRLVSHPDADTQQTEAVRRVIDGVAGDMSLEIQILAALQ